MSEYTPNFRLESDGAHYLVMDRDTQVMEFMNHEMFMGGIFIMGGSVFRPGGPRRICNWVPFWMGFASLQAEVDISVLDGQDSDCLVLQLVPDDPGGMAAARSQMTFTWDAAHDSYAVEHEGWLTFRRAPSAGDLGGFFSMPLIEGGAAWIWQIDDPNYENNYGPSVPMRRDWYHQYEPYTGPDTFRKHWRRGVTHLLSQEPSGVLRMAEAHRGRLFATPLNLNLFPVQPGGRQGARFTDGAGLIYEILSDPPVASHICEWGFDHHYFHVLPTRDGLPAVSAGDVLHCRYRITERSPEAMTALLAEALPLEPDPELLPSVDVPIYEEPVNRFQISYIDPEAQDAFAWTPDGGATWDRAVGHETPGSLRLDVASVQSQPAEWLMTDVGPSLFMNPLVPGARYRLSAWVRVEGKPPVAAPYVRLGVGFKYYQGPGTYGKLLPVELHWSAPADRTRLGEWQQICVETPPVDGYSGGATLLCQLSGCGSAWFDEVVFEPIP